MAKRKVLKGTQLPVSPADINLNVTGELDITKKSDVAKKREQSQAKKKKKKEERQGE